MSVALVGDVVISLILSTVADRLGRRIMLCVGALLIASSGLVFAMSGNYVVLLAGGHRLVSLVRGKRFSFRCVEKEVN